ncbi:MAG: ABC transporter substrate-binding protein [Lentisphaeria bacterium]|nr:ABC transporter substrate-binding protein [Lentisphaeria bacterium]
MNRNTYLNVIVTLFLLLFLALGCVIITALDRHRYALENLSADLKRLESRLTSGIPAAAEKTARAAVNAGTEVQGIAANAEYFDPAAVSGGRLVRAFQADVGNMNMLITNDAYVSQIWSQVTDSLAERDYNDRGDGEFKPMLAESWTISPDRRKVRVRLRKGILWHDFKDPVTGKEWKNREVTAQDVKFYVDVIKNPAVDCAPLRVYYNDLERIDVLNDYEFEVVWSKPYFMMEDMTLSLMPLPRHLYHAYEGPFDGRRFNDEHARNRMLVGCGPYRFESWEKGKRILLRRFENYYGRSLGIMPPLETLAYDIIQHPNTRLQSLLSKDLDMDSLTPDQWVNRTSSPEFGPKGFLKKYSYPGFSYFYIGLNLNNPLFQDKRVRQALSHLVNREKIRREIFFGLMDAVSGPFPKQSSAYDPSVQPYSFDPAAARRLLAEAGWKEGQDGILRKDGRELAFTVVYPNTSVSFQKMLPVIKEDMKKAGVRMDLLGIEWSVLVQRLEKKQFEACLLGWTGTLKPDPYQLWHSSQADQPASSNHIGFVNPKADELIEKIRQCFDPAERTRLYHEFHRLIHDEAPYLFLFSPSSLVVINDAYRNVRLFPGGIATRPLWLDAQRRSIP